MKIMGETSIADLNDDCMLHIFEYVSTQDRINLESVCKRWRYLSPLSWRKVHSFDVCSLELGHIAHELNPEDFGENDIGVSICQQVFKKCFPHLRKINLSRLETPRTTTLMNMMWHECSLQFRSQSFPAGTLNQLKDYLLRCEKLEELWLCRCVIDLDDVFLSELFAKNKNLRKLVLIQYKLDGECFSHLTSENLEALILFECIILQPQCLSSIVSRASNLNTLSVSVTNFDSETLGFSYVTGSSRNLLGFAARNEDDVPQPHDFLYNICNLANLTILGLRDCGLNDSMLRTISMSCANLIVLDIENCNEITDVGLQYTSFMPKLKCLDIGLNEYLSDIGLLTINKNLQLLRIYGTTFSRRALLTVLWEMRNLKELDISHCYQFDNTFIEYAIDIVKLRRDRIPLEIGLWDSIVKIEKIRNACPLVKLNGCYLVDYDKYCQ